MESLQVDDGKIHGCYRNHRNDDEKQGQLRVVSEPEKCRNNETPLPWPKEAGVPAPTFNNDRVYVAGNTSLSPDLAKPSNLTNPLTGETVREYPFFGRVREQNCGSTRIFLFAAADDSPSGPTPPPFITLIDSYDGDIVATYQPPTDYWTRGTPRFGCALPTNVTLPLPTVRNRGFIHWTKEGGNSCASNAKVKER